MAKRQKQSKPRKRTPQRTCVVCRQSTDKRHLIRLVRTPEGVYVDPTGKRNGRGAYLCDNRECWQRAVQTDILDKALRTTLSEADKDRIREAMP